MSKVFGGIEAFDDASPDDGRLELGVVTAKGIAQWTRALVRTAVGSADRSKFVRTTKARKIRVKLDRKMPYELDGGDEKPVDRLKIRVEPAAITVCVPEEAIMSAATLVPETWELTGDDARETLKRTGRMRLVRDAFVRFRASDGFSHARSLAFVTSLLLVQGVIVLVGIAAALGDTDLSAIDRARHHRGGAGTGGKGADQRGLPRVPHRRVRSVRRPRRRRGRPRSSPGPR